MLARGNDVAVMKIREAEHVRQAQQHPGAAVISFDRRLVCACRRLDRFHPAVFLAGEDRRRLERQIDPAAVEPGEQRGKCVLVHEAARLVGELESRREAKDADGSTTAMRVRQARRHADDSTRIDAAGEGHSQIGAIRGEAPQQLRRRLDPALGACADEPREDRISHDERGQLSVEHRLDERVVGLAAARAERRFQQRCALAVERAKGRELAEECLIGDAGEVFDEPAFQVGPGLGGEQIDGEVAAVAQSFACGGDERVEQLLKWDRPAAWRDRRASARDAHAAIDERRPARQRPRTSGAHCAQRRADRREVEVVPAEAFFERVPVAARDQMAPSRQTLVGRPERIADQGGHEGVAYPLGHRARLFDDSREVGPTQHDCRPR